MQVCTYNSLHTHMGVLITHYLIMGYVSPPNSIMVLNLLSIIPMSLHMANVEKSLPIT